MNLNKDNMKSLLLIIVLTILIYTAFQNVSIILYYISIACGISIPFFIGGAIAFVLNVPMKAIENRIFNNKILKDKVPKN